MKVLGGFYYVECDNQIYECKARGSFRKCGNSPLVGDRVKISVQKEGFASLDEILPRKNKLKRPPLANIDILVIVCSTVSPSPNYAVIDKMTAAAINSNMQPVIVISKDDIESGEKVADIYKNAGFEVFCTSPQKTDEAERLKALLMGNSDEADILQEQLNCLILTAVISQTHPDFQPLICRDTKLLIKTNFNIAFPNLKSISENVCLLRVLILAKKAAEFCRHLLTEILRKPVTTVMLLCTMR